jgi:hypothetical protein
MKTRCPNIGEHITTSAVAEGPEITAMFDIA